MATPSYKWYQTSVLAWMWNEEAIRNSWSEVPWYEMFANTWTQSTPTDTWLSKNKEVEIWLGKSVYSPMSDSQKREYLDSLTDEQYRQMYNYKNQWYSFEASRTLLENSEWLANPTAQWTDKYNPKWNFFRNMVWWAWDSATWIGQFLWNTAADIIGRTAKKLWADEDRVNYLVDDFKNYLEDSKISKSVKANTNSWTYKVTKWVTDLAQVVWLEWIAKDAMPKVAWKLWALREAWLGWKVAAWALEWAADMGLYKIVSDSEMPTWKDLAIWAALWWALPIAWAWLKAAWKAIKKEAWVWAEKLIEKITKVSPAKLQKFENQFGENVGKFMNDRWLKTRKDAAEYFVNNIKKVDEALWSIQWTFKSPVVDDVLTESIEFATKTADNNLNRLLELQQKATNEWLTMSEVNEVKRYFEWHTKFTYGKSQDAIKASKATNLDTRLREWQMQTAKESWLDNLAQLNRETQASRYILDNAKDAWEWILWPVDVTDELLAIHYGWLDRALSTYVTKSLLKSAKFQAKAVDILNRLAWHQNIEAILADLETISKVNTEKEFEALMKKRELDQALPAPKAWWVNDAWYTILEQWENMVSWPNWNKVMDSVTEIWWWNTQWYVNGSQAVRPQVEVSTPKAQTKVVEQTKAVEQTPKVSETVVNSEKPNLREMLWDDYYSYLEWQVEMVNKSRKWIKDPISIEDLDLSSDFYYNNYLEMTNDKMKELQKKAAELAKWKPSTALTTEQKELLNKTKSEKKKRELIKQRQDEYIEKNYKWEEYEELMKLSEQFEKLIADQNKWINYLRSLQK